MEMIHGTILLILAPETTASGEVETHRKMVVHGIGAVVTDVERHTGTRQVAALEGQTDTETQSFQRIEIALLCRNER